MSDLHRLVALPLLAQFRNGLIDIHLDDMNRSEMLILFKTICVAMSLPFLSYWWSRVHYQARRHCQIFLGISTSFDLQTFLLNSRTAFDFSISWCSQLSPQSVRLQLCHLNRYVLLSPLYVVADFHSIFLPSSFLLCARVYPGVNILYRVL